MARVLASLMHDGFLQPLAGCSPFGNHCQDGIFCSAAIPRSCQTWDQALHFWQLMPQAGPSDLEPSRLGMRASAASVQAVAGKPEAKCGGMQQCFGNALGFGSRLLRRLVKGQILESFDSGHGK